MTLVFSRPLAGERSLHALVVGVSSYTHLPGGSGDQALNNYGMRQLTSTALSAHNISKWLIDRMDKLSAPLATCRVLLSPSPGETAAQGIADPCTRRKFVTEARAWQSDARSRDDNVTFFYFSGHGIRRTKADSVLLMEDFGDPNEGTLNNAADIVNIFNGMAPPADGTSMARTQFYFVDTCRVMPSEFKDFEKMTVPDVFDVELSGREDRQAPIFFATLSGVKAYAIDNEQTLFNRALLKCLNGAAGDRMEEKEDGTAGWHVSVQSLNKVLDRHLEMLTTVSGIDQEFALGGNPTGDATIHILDGPPMVDVSLEVLPQEAVPFTEFKIINGSGTPAHPLPVPLSPHPHNIKVPAGVYTIDATITPPNALYVNRPGEPRGILPPISPCKRRVTP